MTDAELRLEAMRLAVLQTLRFALTRHFPNARITQDLTAPEMSFEFEAFGRRFKITLEDLDETDSSN